MVFISESKCNNERAEFIKRSMGFGGCFSVDSMGRSGGLILFWRNSAEVIVRSFSKGHVDVVVREENLNWRFTSFYGDLDPTKREDSWKLIERLNDNLNLP